MFETKEQKIVLDKQVKMPQPLHRLIDLEATRLDIYHYQLVERMWQAYEASLHAPSDNQSNLTKTRYSPQSAAPVKLDPEVIEQIAASSARKTLDLIQGAGRGKTDRDAGTKPGAIHIAHRSEQEDIGGAAGVAAPNTPARHDPLLDAIQRLPPEKRALIDALKDLPSSRLLDLLAIDGLLLAPTFVHAEHMKAAVEATLDEFRKLEAKAASKSAQHRRKTRPA